MSSYKLALLLGALQVATAFRMNRKANPVLRVAGVPVYNTKRSISSAETKQDWILMLKDDVSEEQLHHFCDDASTTCTPEGHAGIVPFVVMHGSFGDLKDMLTSHKDIVSYAEPEFEMQIIPEMPEVGTQADTSVSSSSWGLSKIGVGDAGRQGEGVHIYVLDTGVRTTHNDFGGRAIPTLEVTSSSPQECRGSTYCARDSHGHGTHCAATAGGSSYGVAPKSTIHGVKVLSDQGTGSGSWTISAIDWVVSKGQRPTVISMSLGAKGVSQSDKTAINKATGAGITVVVASGNENDNACGYSPAHVPSAITVGSTDSMDRRSSFSNYGNCVNIYAPGSSITSAGHRSDSASATMSGTSMACPHVSGAAAVLLDAYRDMSSSEVLSALLNNAQSGKLSGLMSGDPNKLLDVRGLGNGLAPTPAPTPAPSPDGPGAACPKFAIYPTADSDGDCVCPFYSWCSRTGGSTRDCPFSGGVGGNTGRYFSYTCTNCKCLGAGAR